MMDAQIGDIKKGIVSLIYLWARDAEMATDKETEDYIIDHLQKIRISKETIFSDGSRADMAKRILEKI